MNWGLNLTCFNMQDRDTFSLKLEDTENWLYEDGEDQQKQVYIDKLAELKVSRLVVFKMVICSLHSFGTLSNM